MPIVQGAEKLVAKRRADLDEQFLTALEYLSVKYTPVICLDTAELLEQEDRDQPPGKLTTDALDWLNRFLDLAVSRNCLVIIAGRPRNEDDEPFQIQIRDQNGQVQTTTLADFLARKRPPHQFKPFQTGILKRQDIQAYFYWYQEYTLNAQGQSLNLALSIPDLAIFQQKASAAWPSVVEELKYQDILQANLTPDQVYTAVEGLTGGKPLSVDWLCQLAFTQGKRLIPGIKPDGTPHPAAFRREIGQIIGKGEFNFNIPDIDDDSIKQVLRYAYIARKGLDADTIELLSLSEEKPINRELAQTILKILVKFRFIKVRTIDSGDTISIFLHDEIYASLRHNIGIPNVTGVASQLVYAYVTNAGYQRSIRWIEWEYDKVRRTDLKWNSATQQIEQRFWFADAARIEIFFGTGRQIAKSSGGAALLSVAS